MALMKIFTPLLFLSQDSWISRTGKQLPICLPFTILPKKEKKKNVNVKVDISCTLKMHEIKLYYKLCSGSHTLFIHLLQCASMIIVVQIFSQDVGTIGRKGQHWQSAHMHTQHVPAPLRVVLTDTKPSVLYSSQNKIEVFPQLQDLMQQRLASTGTCQAPDVF